MEKRRDEEKINQRIGTGTYPSERPSGRAGRLPVRTAIWPGGPLTAIFMLSLTEKLLLTPWCKEHSIKVIWIEHDRVGKWLTRNPWLPLLKRLSALATTVCVSNMSAEIYRRMGWKGKIIAIPNGIDLPKTESIERIERASPSFRVGCIARFTKDKGVDVLIEAVKDLPALHLSIIGSGREEKMIRSLLAKNLPPANYIVRETVENVSSFYRSIDLLVLPSRDHDPFGLVIAEAMASNIPTICTDACGIASHLLPEECLVVKAGDAADLRAGILRMSDPLVRKKYAEQGRKAVQKKFSVEKMVDEYVRLL
ncbi:MAG TPA: glycosyltransferase family 4 protein [Candidatus Peribacterales bacterium]|nr:glycosyltransferase family 4 protein [Candidatus Peribacterales bacterium]